MQACHGIGETAAIPWEAAREEYAQLDAGHRRGLIPDSFAALTGRQPSVLLDAPAELKDHVAQEAALEAELEEKKARPAGGGKSKPYEAALLVAGRRARRPSRFDTDEQNTPARAAGPA